MTKRAISAIVAFLVLVPSVSAAAQEPVKVPPDVLESLGMSVDELLAVQPNPAWDGLGLFSPDAQRILESAGEPAEFITYAFGDDPNGVPVINPSGATPVERGTMLWQLPDDWNPPAEGLTDTMAFTQTAASQLTPGEIFVLMWVEMDSDYDFTSGLTINEGFPLTIPGRPVWNSTFAGDTWEGANLIPNAVFSDGSLDFEVKQYDGASGFSPVDVPGFYYRSGNIMAMALSASSLADMVGNDAPASTRAGTGSSANQQLLFRGGSDDQLTQANPLAVLAMILEQGYSHLAAARMFTPGYIFLLSTQLLVIRLVTVLATNFAILITSLAASPEPVEIDTATDAPTTQPATTPTVESPASTSGSSTSTGGGSNILVPLILIFVLALMIGLWISIGRTKRRSKPGTDTEGPTDGGSPTTIVEDEPIDTSSPAAVPPASHKDGPTVRPLIFVPGIMASAIQANTDHGPEPLWPPIGFSGDLRKCMETLQGTDSANLSVFEGSPNGLLPGIHLGLIGFLAKHGYRLDPGDRRPPNLYIHAYNWLESCSVAAVDLVELIKRATAEHGVPPSIIAHSMGGLVTRAALSNGKTAVDKVFYDASPHLGAPMAYYSIHPDIPYKFLPGVAGRVLNAGYAMATSGADFDLPMVDDDSWAITKAVWAAAKAVEIGVETVAHALGGSDAFDAQMKLISQNATGVFELLPDELYFTHINTRWPVVTHERRWYRRHGSFERHDYVPSTAAEAYRSDGPKDLPALPTHLSGKIEAALAFKASMSGPLPPGGADRTFVIYGAEHETVCEAVMTDDGPADRRGDIECTLGGDQKGDGTVPTESGRGEPLWGAGVEVYRDNTAEHFMMTETATFHAILTQHLRRGGR